MKYIEKELKRYSFRHSSDWENYGPREIIELTDLPLCQDDFAYKNSLHLTKREAKSLLKFLQEVLDD